MIGTCQLCGASAVREELDLGLQPICNRFLNAPDAVEDLYPLALGQCAACGLVQLTRQPPAEALRPRVEWITYNEPEPHLDGLAQTIARLLGSNADARIWGVSFKDDSLLKRIERLGFPNTYRLDQQADLGITQRGVGVETIQDCLSVERARALVAARGNAQVVIARHIVEHAYSIRGFLDALSTLLSPGGYLVLEAPDCTRVLELNDYTTIWEEHTAYLTPRTFRSAFTASRLALVRFAVFPYVFENSLVGIGQISNAPTRDAFEPGTVAEEHRRFQAFVRSLPIRREQLRRYFADFRARKGKIALLGAGHLSCGFVNFLGLKEQFAFFTDDNPHKQGAFMPGSRLAIRGSVSLLEENVRLCLLCLNPENEDRVVEKNRAFVERGGEFASIFPASPRALQVE